MHPLYLMHHLSPLHLNIHQYISGCTHKIYLVRFFFLCVFEPPEAKMSQNAVVLARNPTGFLRYSSKLLGTWNPINTASLLSELFFSPGSTQTRARCGRRKMRWFERDNQPHEHPVWEGVISTPPVNPIDGLVCLPNWEVQPFTHIAHPHPATNSVHPIRLTCLAPTQLIACPPSRTDGEGSARAAQVP